MAFKRTHSRGLVAKVLRAVATPETLGLALGSSSTGELLVEAHNLLHANSILGGADALYVVSMFSSEFSAESRWLAEVSMWTG
jgi:hypothetical protein